MKRAIALAMGASEKWQELEERLSAEAEVLVIRTSSPATLVRQLAREPVGVIVLVLNEHRRNAPEVVAAVKQFAPAVPIIAYSPEPADLDADVIQEGLFCYMGGAPVDSVAEAVHAALTRGDRKEST
ncbi:MAG: hypothetical protein HYY16_01890 [Planctomycetes bacterium]|nr:hypothetical protein [Planctomycetota bacterium]